MRVNGLFLLACWLIAVGLVDLLQLNFAGREAILAVAALAAGILLIWERRFISITSNLPMLLLSIWLIAQGVFSLAPTKPVGLPQLLGVLAIVAGILLIRRP